MRRVLLAVTILAGACLAAASVRAATPVDGVKVLVPGQTEVDFIEYSDAVGAPEFFVGTTFLPIGFQEATVFLTEPGTHGGYSDALTILTNTTGGVDIFFASDPVSLSLVHIAARQFSIEETGKWQDVSGYFGQGPGFAQVISDVPEPAVWAMMILGVGMVGGALRRRNGMRLA